MNKAKAIKLAGGVRQLAEVFGIHRQAVAAWKTIPALRVYQLRELRPEWFGGVDIDAVHKRKP